MGPKGLGDAIYLRAIVLRLLREGAELTVFTSWPEVFDDLPIETRPRSEAWSDEPSALRYPISPNRERRLGRCQGSEFATSCRQAGLSETADLVLDRPIKDRARLDEILRAAGGRPICIYQPRKRPKNTIQELLSPNRNSFRRALEALAPRHALVKVGHPEFVIDDAGLPCDLDLVGPNTVPLILDLSGSAAAFFGEACCFIPVLAQACAKPFSCLFSRRAIMSDDPLASGAVPQWIIHQPELATVLFDDALA